MLYKEARDIANKAIEENIVLKKALNKEQSLKANKPLPVDEEKELTLSEKKQEQLNQLQLKYDKIFLQHQDLQARYQALTDESEILRGIIEREDTGGDTDDDIAVVSNEEPYPKGTVLFGGHENWQ